MKKQKKKRGRGLLILLIIIAALAYFVHDSAVNIELTEYSVTGDRIPRAFDGFRIVQISDFHGAEFPCELADMVRQQNPDIIAITGDIITEAEQFTNVEKLLTELQGIAPVYFVSGNHDFASGQIGALSELFERYGVEYLANEYICLERDGERIVLAGVEDPNSWEGIATPDAVAEKLRSEYPDEYTVLLGHRNYWAEEYPDLPVDLILCGHAHGGLIRLPGVGGLISTDRTLFPDYEAGLYHCGGYELIVSRGLGNSVPVPRLFNRPDLVCITLTAE